MKPPEKLYRFHVANLRSIQAGLEAVLDSARLAIARREPSVIVLRNKLAHGQWAYPLNEQLDDVAQSQMDALRDENILSLKQKSGLIEAFCDSIHDLVVSPPTFERDFDNHFRRVAQLRANL